jgi:hypothetical protein
MKTNIKYAVFDLLLYLMGVSLSLVGIIVLSTSDDEASRFSWVTIVVSLFFLFSVIMLFVSIKNIQWFKIVDGLITIYCPFGTIKQVRLDEIKKAFKDNAVIFQLKMLGIRRPHIVLCLKKSVARKDISDAYNGSKKPYIIIPHSIEAEYLLLTEYKKICGEELIIKK